MSAVPRRKVSAENVSHEINKSVTDLFNFTDEITSQQLAAHKKALVAELNSMDDQATESHCHLPRHSFPRLCHCLHRGVQLVDSGAQDGGQVAALFCEDCFCNAVYDALDVHVVEGSSCRYDSTSGEVFGPL